jgi:hypothetical protein
VDPLIELGPELWPVVEQLPVMGRVFMAAHLALPRPADPLVSGWSRALLARVDATAGPNYQPASRLHT